MTHINSGVAFLTEAQFDSVERERTDIVDKKSEKI